MSHQIKPVSQVSRNVGSFSRKMCQQALQKAILRRHKRPSPNPDLLFFHSKKYGRRTEKQKAKVKDKCFFGRL